MTTFIISNYEIDGIMKIVNSFADSGLLIKRITQTIESETKEQGDRFLSTILGTLETILF